MKLIVLGNCYYSYSNQRLDKHLVISHLALFPKRVKKKKKATQKWKFSADLDSMVHATQMFSGENMFSMQSIFEMKHLHYCHFPLIFY